ncbi:PIG-L family deacetylase [Sinosporangium siamense]|uniref:PIG-L family deacetylase n=1 Tax=Sinosporangium siamense TaxID=1367973 RepID=A0A919V7R4_9ACTN|nr:PIG-L family deacetylase [Sinosporangium siamense]GII92387.1 hypothetical protein Ssi02_26180 [Sinosporangium siamense]
MPVLVERRAGRACAGALALCLAAATFLPFTLRSHDAAALVPAPAGHERFLHVVAHPDDDLLFLSPDMFGAVASGRATATVFLTAGEATAGLDDDYDPLQYIRDREEGIRTAYAVLAGKPNRWRSRLVHAGAARLRMDVLVATPAIRLIFAHLPDGGDPRADGGRDALTRVWHARRRGECARAFSSAAYRPCLDRRDIVEVLTTVFRRFRPTVLRTLDPEPGSGPGHGHDHPDHVAAARFALAAAHEYGDPRLKIVSYRGYSVTSRPPNLDPRLRALKRRVFAVYGRHDYRVRGGGRYHAWTARMYRCPPWAPLREPSGQPTPLREGPPTGGFGPLWWRP